MGDGATVGLGAAALQPAAAAGSNELPVATLMVQCVEGRPRVVLGERQTPFVPSPLDSPLQPVRVRFDGQVAEREEWLELNGGPPAVAAPDPVGFMRRMAHAKRLRVELNTAAGGTHVREWDLEHFADSLPRVEAACKLSAR